jgi:hypothetical protein
VDVLNQVYSSLSAPRRYEVWFIRLGLADGVGAWWFRYLLTNPGREGCPQNPSGMPVQVWATWFPAVGKPKSFIQGFPLSGVELTPRRTSPFHFAIADNAIDANSCRGRLNVGGHSIAWELRYVSRWGFSLSDKGWIGFSRTPHSDAAFSGHIVFDNHHFEGNPVGFGLQGHNCGYRHRTFWRWAHAYFRRPGEQPSTVEALVYDMPLGLMFRKCVLSHADRKYAWRGLDELSQDPDSLQWSFLCLHRGVVCLRAHIDGRGDSIHRLNYLRTDCSGTFELVNNSRANALVELHLPGRQQEILQTAGGAVLEMGGSLGRSAR